MVPKSSFVKLLSLLILFPLAACTSNTSISPTPDQNRVATAVAATLNAANIATQRAISANQPTATPAPTLQLTITAPKNTPTTLPSPTVSIPTSSPLQVAYVKNSDVYLWSDGHDPIRLTDMHDVVDVRLSNDGQLIAFKLQDPEEVTLQELWVVNTQGVPNPQVLVSAQDLAELKAPDSNLNILGYGVFDFTWRPNTHILAYNTLVLHEGPGLGPNHDLRLVNADSLEKTILFETGKGGFFYYSPDGSQIALSNPQSISLIAADGTNPRMNVLTFPEVITYSEYEYHPHPIWADDSRSLGVAIPPHDPLVDTSSPTKLWSIPVDGSAPVLLGNINAIPFAWPDNAFAPNLKHVIYLTPSNGPTNNARDLRLAHPDGSDEVIYDQGDSLEFISWSPDSQHFIYRILSGADKGIYWGGLDAKPKLIIFDPQVAMGIKWLNNYRLVFLLQDGSQWQLLIQDPNSGELTLIDTIPDSNPAFDVSP